MIKIVSSSNLRAFPPCIRIFYLLFSTSDFLEAFLKRTQVCLLFFTFFLSFGRFLVPVLVHCSNFLFFWIDFSMYGYPEALVWHISSASLFTLFFYFTFKRNGGALPKPMQWARLGHRSSIAQQDAFGHRRKNQESWWKVSILKYNASSLYGNWFLSFLWTLSTRLTGFKPIKFSSECPVGFFGFRWT